MVIGQIRIVDWLGVEAQTGFVCLTCAGDPKAKVELRTL